MEACCMFSSDPVFILLIEEASIDDERRREAEYSDASTMMYV